MPAPFTITLMALAFLCAAISIPVAALVLGVVAVAFEVVMLILAGASSE